MVTRLQRKFPLGLGSTDCMDFLNEGFRKINQMSADGFIWQFKNTTVVLPAGAQIANPLPVDFDPGKSAFLYGANTISPTPTLIPYKTPGEFVNQQLFPNQQIAAFACWTFYPNFTLIAPTSYPYTLKLAPNDAFPLAGGGLTLPFFYHAVNFQPFVAAANIFFPTPDQFDSLIIDLAEAELSRIYGHAGWDKIAMQATQAVTALIDTYRTDRYDLAGLTGEAMQAQEKATERAK